MVIYSLTYFHHVDLLWLHLNGSSENYMLRGQPINVLELAETTGMSGCIG